MSILLELLGKGLEKNLISLVLPNTRGMGTVESAFLENELANSPVEIPTLLRLAIHNTQNGSIDQASRIFDEIVTREPQHLEARLAWAGMHCSTGAIDQALRQLMIAYESHTHDARVLFGLGYVHEMLGDITQAVNFYELGCKEKMYLRQNRERLAAICIYKADYPGSIRHCQVLQKEHPEDLHVYLGLGQLYMETGEYDKAVATFEKALTIDPDNFDLHDDQIEKLVKAGLLTEAIQRLEEMIETQGEFPDSFVRLGDVYSQSDNDEKAIENYNKALEIHTGYLEAAIKLGTQHLRKQRHLEAARSFNRAVEINDQLITAYVGLGVAQCAQGKAEQGCDTLDLASSLEPNTNLLFAEVSRLQLKLAQVEKAKNEYLDFVKEPSQPRQEKHGDSLLELQLKRHEEALVRNPNQADLHYRYGLLLQCSGKNDKAIEHFGQAVEINGSYLKAKIKLGLALREQDNKNESLSHLRDAFTLKQEYADLHYKLALLYCDRIQFALAVEQFDSTANNGSANSNVHANLDLALQNMGLVDRAAAVWRAVCELDPHSQMAFQAQRSGVTLGVH